MSTNPLFPLLGEPIALDLVNTQVRCNGRVVDLLDLPSALRAWLCAEEGRVTWCGPVSPDDVAAIRGFRNVISVLIKARRLGEQPPADTIRQFNQVLSMNSASRELVWGDTGPQIVHDQRTEARQSLLRVLVDDAAALLTGLQAKLLRECAHPDCILQFVATNPRRRWCSAATCGNRARVARNYHRNHPTR